MVRLFRGCPVSARYCIHFTRVCSSAFVNSRWLMCASFWCRVRLRTRRRRVKYGTLWAVAAAYMLLNFPAWNSSFALTNLDSSSVVMVLFFTMRAVDRFLFTIVAFCIDENKMPQGPDSSLSAGPAVFKTDCRLSHFSPFAEYFSLYTTY